MKGNDTAYVSSDRDREVVVVDVSSPTAGPPDQAHQARRQRARHDARRVAVELYVAQDNADQVAVIDTSTNRVIARIDARAPAACCPSRKYTGAATSAVTLSPDGDTLYAVNSGANSIAVIPLTGHKAHDGQRPDPDRLRAARHHVQRRRLVDVHRQRQERHRPESRPPGQQHRQHHEHHLPGRQRRRRGRVASVEPVSVPAGTRVAGQRAGAEPRVTCSELTERVAEEQLLLDRDRRAETRR